MMIKLFLQNRNFRSLLMFSTFSGIGQGMFSIFMMWALHAIYQNTIYTGIAGFMFGAPLIMSFLVGPLVDRWNKAKVLRVVEFIKFCVVTLVLIAYMFLYIGPWFFFLAIFIFSIATMFGNPAFTALLPRVVDSEDLVRANVAMNIAGIAGGLGLGLTLMAMSAGELEFTQFYSVNSALLFFSTLFALFVQYKEPIEVVAKESKTALKAYISELGEGFSFIKKEAMLFLTIAVVSLSFFGNIAHVNFPMLIEVRLGDASSYMLLSFLALTGSIIGSYICRVTESKYKLWMILAASLIFAGMTRIIFINILEDNFRRATLMYLMYTGLGAVIGIFYQIIVQKLPPKDLISRVYTVSRSMSAIAAAIGALVGGIMGRLLYIDTVFFIQGGTYIIIGVLLCFSAHIRNLPKVSDIGKCEDEPTI